jgi:hypothetical protein
MALPSDVTTRVDQLHADLRRVAAQHKCKAGVPDPAPMFTTHADGAVYDRQGNKIRGPFEVKP